LKIIVIIISIQMKTHFSLYMPTIIIIIKVT